MNYEIVKMKQLSGNEANIYSIIPKGKKSTLYDAFLNEYSLIFQEEILDIQARLSLIGNTTGAKLHFFKDEGDKDFVKKYGKCVCALYDNPKKNLRLYCIRFSNLAIILGGGGHKSKSVIKWQDDPKLTIEVKKLMTYARLILDQIKSGDITWSDDGKELFGNLKNYDNE